MDFKFPFNRDVEQAQEKILQAKSAQEIKDLLKQDDPQKPNYQEGLVRLVTQHIMKQFPQEEIDRIEKIPHLNPNSKYDGVSVPSLNYDRSREIMNLASKTRNQFTGSIIAIAAQKHDPFMIPKEHRSFVEPEKDIRFSIANAALEYIKNQPSMVEKIFDDVLPRIRQEKQISPMANVFMNSEKEKYASSFSNGNSKEIETAHKAGYVQGVCECVAAIVEDQTLGKKLLSEMKVDRDMAKKYANPETFKTLEQGIFAQKPERKQELEQTQTFKL